jgi:glycosyltransferase involved in cell wall biosynthesis
MTIDVVMPVFETPVEWCREAIESIRIQSLKANNLIIVDDNNKPGDLKEYLYEQATCECKTIVVKTNENKGIAAALNLGLSNCTSDLIVRMDSDDIARPNLLELHNRYFEAFPKRHICGVQIKLFSKSRVWYSNHPAIVTKEFAYSDLGFWFVNQPGIAYRRETVKSLGYYGDIPFNLAEDYALWIKFLRAGYLIYNRKEILIDYRVHPKSFSYAPDRKAPEWYEFLNQQKKSLYE